MLTDFSRDYLPIIGLPLWFIARRRGNIGRISEPEQDVSRITPRNQEFVTIDDIVKALAERCDGAKSRDGEGFNRSDANEGGRLAALRSAGLPWSIDDARKAEEIIAKYSKQAGIYLADGDEKRQSGIEKAVRGGRVILGHAPSDAQEAYNYAGLSPGGKRAYLWRMSWIQDVKGLFSDLRGIAGMQHGDRRIQFEMTRNAEMTINGERRKMDRYEVDLNGTSQSRIIDICGRHGFVMEPALRSAIDPEIDAIRRHSKSAWIHRGTRYGVRGEWILFDLARKDDQFSSVMKQVLRGHYVCEPDDDWNWFVPVDPATNPMVRRIAKHFRFAVTRDFAATTAVKAPA